MIMFDIGVREEKNDLEIQMSLCVCVCMCTNSVWMALSANTNIAVMWTDIMSAVSYQLEKSGSKASCWYIFQRYRCNYIEDFGDCLVVTILAFL